MSRKGKLSTQVQKKKFLQLYTKHRNISKVAALMHMGASTVYNALKADPAFKYELTLINEMTADELEEILLDRIKKGTKKGVYHRGTKVAEEVVYDSSLLLAALEAYRPARFNKAVVRSNLEKEREAPKEIDVDEAKNKLWKRLEMIKDNTQDSNVIEGEYTKHE